jgi:hypothetical protein
MAVAEALIGVVGTIVVVVYPILYAFLQARGREQNAQNAQQRRELAQQRQQAEQMLAELRRRQIDPAIVALLDGMKQAINDNKPEEAERLLNEQIRQLPNEEQEKIKTMKEEIQREASIAKDQSWVKSKINWLLSKDLKIISDPRQTEETRSLAIGRLRGLLYKDNTKTPLQKEAIKSEYKRIYNRTQAIADGKLEQVEQVEQVEQKKPSANSAEQLLQTIEKFKYKQTPIQRNMRIANENQTKMNEISKKIKNQRNQVTEENRNAIMNIKTRLMSQKDNPILPEQKISNKELPLVEIDNCNIITNLLDMNPNTVYLYKMNAAEREKALKSKDIQEKIKSEKTRLEGVIAKEKDKASPYVEKLERIIKELNEPALACYINIRDNQYNYKPILSSQLQSKEWLNGIEKDENTEIDYVVQGVLLDKIQRRVQGSLESGNKNKSFLKKRLNAIEGIGEKTKEDLVNIYAINETYAIDYLEKVYTTEIKVNNNKSKVGIIRLQQLKHENMNWYPVLTKLVIANNGTIDGAENIKLDNLIKDNKGMALFPRPVIPDIQQLKKEHGLDGITFQWETVLKGVSPALYDNYLKRKGKFNKPSGSNSRTVTVTVTPKGNNSTGVGKVLHDNPLKPKYAPNRPSRINSQLVSTTNKGTPYEEGKHDEVDASSVKSSQSELQQSLSNRNIDNALKQREQKNVIRNPQNSKYKLSNNNQKEFNQMLMDFNREQSQNNQVPKQVKTNNVKVEISPNPASSQSEPVNSGIGVGLSSLSKGGKRRHKTSKGKPRRNHTHRVHYRRHRVSSIKKNKRNNRTHRK